MRHRSPSPQTSPALRRHRRRHRSPVALPLSPRSPLAPSALRPFLVASRHASCRRLATAAGATAVGKPSPDSLTIASADRIRRAHGCVPADAMARRSCVRCVRVVVSRLLRCAHGHAPLSRVESRVVHIISTLVRKLFQSLLLRVCAASGLSAQAKSCESARPIWPCSPADAPRSFIAHRTSQ